VSSRGQCGVRKVLMAIAVLIVVVWLIPYDPQPDGQMQVPPLVAPVVATPESGSTATEDAQAVVAPDAAAANEPPVLFPHQLPATPISRALEDLNMPPMPDLVEAERAFAAERVDPIWAGAMEGQILGEIARTAGLQPVTLQVECRTSMCRLHFVERQSQTEPRIVFPSVGSGRNSSDPQIASFTDLVSRLELDPRWVALVVDGNRTPNSLAYLARRDRDPRVSP
jgi:hypothetical protein